MPPLALLVPPLVPLLVPLLVAVEGNGRKKLKLATESLVDVAVPLTEP